MNTAVVLYRPNMIGYVRIVLLFVSMFCSGTPFVLLYLASVSLDYFDGMAARYFGEESKLGACLDMITDRISTTVLCIKIIAKKPHYTKRCMVYIFLDLLSHFVYFTSMVHGDMHHKSFDRSYLLQFYYNPHILRIMCTGSEAYFLFLYHTKKPAPLLRMLSVVPLVKTFFHVMHLYIGVCVLSTIKNK